MLLDLRNYPAHRLDGKPRVRARRGLGGKHDSIGTVENRIRDVARFGAGWTRVRNHRLEHLRCCDYRLANAICERDYPLLCNRDFLEWKFHTKITARDHHGVRGANDGFDVGECRILFYLGDNSNPRRQQRAERCDVLSTPNETQRQVVKILRDREFDIGYVLVGKRWRGYLNAGEIEPLVTSQQSAVYDAGVNARRVHIERDHFDKAIINQDAVADLHILRERRVCNGDLSTYSLVLVHQHNVVARLQRNTEWQLTNPDSRPLKVAEDGNRLAHVLRNRANHPDTLRMVRVRSVRKIQSRNIHPSFGERSYGVERRTRWAKRTDNFCAADV